MDRRRFFGAAFGLGVSGAALCVSKPAEAVKQEDNPQPHWCRRGEWGPVTCMTYRRCGSCLVSTLATFNVYFFDENPSGVTTIENGPVLWDHDAHPWKRWP